jgi:hypothetical protein
MEQALLSVMWQAIYKSKVVDIRAVYKARGGATYLAKYLVKETGKKRWSVRRGKGKWVKVCNCYWASYNWVFQGWVGWSQRVKRVVEHYPSKRLLQSLARVDKVKR